VLKADDGKILTNGKIYGTKIILSVSEESKSFHEITVDEYNKIAQEIDITPSDTEAENERL